ncbi:MAG: hypothetical protein WCX81_02595 [Monoglobales bacterium]
MNAYIMLLGMTLINLTALILIKKFQLGVKSSASFLSQANLISAVIACACLWATNKFVINVTGVALVYSAIYGLLSTMSIFFFVYSYSRISIALTTIIGAGGSIVVPMLFGLIFNGEPISARLIISALLILTAVVLPIFNDVPKKSVKGTIPFLTAYFIFTGLPGILNKLYTQENNVVDTISYFFLTNAVMFLISGICIIFFSIKNKGFRSLEKLPLRWYYNCGLRTVLSLFSSYLSLTIIAIMPISLYSVLSSSLGLAGTALISRFFFKEKLPVITVFSLILAICSFIIGV